MPSPTNSSHKQKQTVAFYVLYCAVGYRSLYIDWLRAEQQLFRSSSPGEFKSFVFSPSSKAALEPTQTVQCIPATVSPGVKPLSLQRDPV
jgi:hypothetical protein